MGNDNCAFDTNNKQFVRSAEDAGHNGIYLPIKLIREQRKCLNIEI